MHTGGSLVQADLVHLLSWQDQCSDIAQLAHSQILFLLFGVTAQQHLIHAQAQLSYGSAGTKNWPSLFYTHAGFHEHQ